MNVSEIMNKIVVADLDISVRDAAKIMARKHIGSLVLLHKNNIVGIVTERDIVKNIHRIGQKVSAIMSKHVIFIDSDDNLDDASLKMAANKIKRLPVMKAGKLVGIITATDILANSEELNEEFFFD